mmetsp:Transcript_40679/g.116865  ORF Transcript_40679/g.116865 Transcript_40679/m.116865 type:complete len:207 (+) Transcript_40679:1361-1981(+)
MGRRGRLGRGPGRPRARSARWSLWPARRRRLRRVLYDLLARCAAATGRLHCGGLGGRPRRPHTRGAGRTPEAGHHRRLRLLRATRAPLRGSAAARVLRCGGLGHRPAQLPGHVSRQGGALPLFWRRRDLALAPPLLDRLIHLARKGIGMDALVLGLVALEEHVELRGGEVVDERKPLHEHELGELPAAADEDGGRLRVARALEAAE